MLAVDYAPEVAAEDAVDEHEHEVVVDVQSGFVNSVDESELFALVSVGGQNPS